MIENLKAYQQKIALSLGLVAVAAIGFYGGKSINSKPLNDAQLPSVSASSNYTQTKPAAQTDVSTAQTPSEPLNCEGKIKGSSTHKYHMPGGVFYKKTTRPIACFDTEAEAKAAGFIKSSR
ncbi:MAG: hypothetical protein KW788_00195 [Candidatus Doudnabacteria bacterium]|nr:hypothetical protein [Candidatus Doudnabacteria bacterium]